MKRDCGQGELKPTSFEVVSCSGMNDDEVETSHATLNLALTEFGNRQSKLLNIPCSDVRLYAKDKQGYCNCIKSWIFTATKQTCETNRLSEL